MALWENKLLTLSAGSTPWTEYITSTQAALRNQWWTAACCQNSEGELLPIEANKRRGNNWSHCDAPQHLERRARVTSQVLRCAYTKQKFDTRSRFSYASLPLNLWQPVTTSVCNLQWLAACKWTVLQWNSWINQPHGAWDHFVWSVH